MRYAATYTNKLTTQQLLEFDEIIIKYNERLEALYEFCKQHQPQRIIIYIDDIDYCIEHRTIHKLNVFHETYPQFNLAIQLGAEGRFNEALLQKCLRAYLDVESRLPIFFGMYASTFEELEAMSAFAMSDLYITEDLGFDLARVRHICGDKVTIRAIANIAQSKVRSTLPILQFFIRPEDVKTFEMGIDVIQFWGPEDRQSVLLTIYKGGNWYGDLKDLILDFAGSIESRRIIPNFAFARTTCQRRCMKGDACRYCFHVMDTAESLKKKELIIADK